jgi:hypothetical protein
MRERYPEWNEEDTHFNVDPPELPIVSVPTLDPKTARPLSPQLRDWYAVAGTVVEGSWKYLAPSELRLTVKRRKVRGVVAAHREDWDDSAPMQFASVQLSVFALIGDLVDGDIIYLVWPKAEAVEPEVWSYFGQSETRHKDLVAYVTWLIA